MRLLVIEDHEKLARSLAGGLREEGYAVDLTFDGAEGAALARANSYDAIVLDLNLPSLDGLELLRRLRAEGRATPVLCLTARDGIDDRIGGLDAGADDYLVKPFNFDELLARLRAVIRRSHNHPSSLIQIADLEIDLAGRTVKRGGAVVQLSAREYELLELLALHCGRVMSREEIARHLYDQVDQVGSNVVDVYVGYLRNKIDKPFATRLIHTRRGMGYVLSDQAESEAP